MRMTSIRCRETVFAALILFAVSLGTQGCASSSSSGGEGQWSRSFLQPRERVFSACLESLEATGFDIRTSDAETGKIRAVPADVEDFRGSVLEVEVYVRGEITVVELASIGSPSTSLGVRRPEPGAMAFLLDLEERLRAMAAAGDVSS